MPTAELGMFSNSIALRQEGHIATSLFGEETFAQSSLFSADCGLLRPAAAAAAAVFSNVPLRGLQFSCQKSTLLRGSGAQGFRFGAVFQ